MITHVIFQLVLFAGMLLLLLLFMKLHHDARHESNAALDRVEKKSTERILKAELNMQENTYRDIAMEIHDHVSHKLALCRLQLEQAMSRKENESAYAMGKSNELLSDAIDFLSSLSRRLDNHELDSSSLPDAILRAISFFPTSYPIKVDFKQEGSLYSLGSSTELHLYRIVQEALSNVVKHSKATEVKINFDYSSTRFECTIRDNGVGFDEHAPENYGGSGFQNMKRRAMMIGAALEISSIPFNGTLIRIYLPPLNQN